MSEENEGFKEGIYQVGNYVESSIRRNNGAKTPIEAVYVLHEVIGYLHHTLLSLKVDEESEQESYCGDVQLDVEKEEIDSIVQDLVKSLFKGGDKRGN